MTGTSPIGHLPDPIPRTILRSMEDAGGTLLYDADCGICGATARWLERRVAPAQLRLLAIGDVASAPSIAEAVRGRNLAASLHFVGSDGRVLAGARAVLAAGRTVPRWRYLARLADHPLGYAVLEPLYRQIASHRRRIGRRLGLAADCAVPARQDAAPRSASFSRSRSGIR
jgi:predicted DCC family thiol-disulfide oxidoreductase YuxK